MPRWISWIVALLALTSVLSSGGYVMARWYDWAWVASWAGSVLKWSLYLVVGCAAYALLVGLYHTALFVTGLDEARPDETAGPESRS